MGKRGLSGEDWLSSLDEDDFQVIVMPEGYTVLDYIFAVVDDMDDTEVSDILMTTGLLQ